MSDRKELIATLLRDLVRRRRMVVHERQKGIVQANLWEEER
jgi:hypothetical protein